MASGAAIVVGIVILMAGAFLYLGYTSQASACGTDAGQLEQSLDPSFAAECNQANTLTDGGIVAAVAGFIILLLGCFVEESKPSTTQYTTILTPAYAAPPPPTSPVYNYPPVPPPPQSLPSPPPPPPPMSAQGAATKYCPWCGNATPTDHRFCRECGKQV